MQTKAESWQSECLFENFLLKNRFRRLIPRKPLYATEQSSWVFFALIEVLNDNSLVFLHIRKLELPYKGFEWTKILAKYIRKWIINRYSSVDKRFACIFIYLVVFWNNPLDGFIHYPYDSQSNYKTVIAYCLFLLWHCKWPNHFGCY